VSEGKEVWGRQKRREERGRKRYRGLTRGWREREKNWEGRERKGKGKGIPPLGSAPRSASIGNGTVDH